MIMLNDSLRGWLASAFETSRVQMVWGRIRHDSLVYAEAWTYACLVFASYHHGRSAGSSMEKRTERRALWSSER